MSAVPGHGPDRQGRPPRNADLGEAPWDLQLQAVEQRMARRRREIRHAWGALEQQTSPLRWARSALVPGVIGLAGGALLALLWRRRGPGPSEGPSGGRRSWREPAAEAPHPLPGLGAVLVAAAWPLLRQMVQPAIERAAEAQLAALAERWLRPRAAGGQEDRPPSSTRPGAAAPSHDAKGKT